MKTSSHVLRSGLLALLLLAASGVSAAAPDRVAAAPAAGAQEAPSCPLASAMSRPVPVLTCGPGLILGTYTAYYSDPAKTMYVCEKSCGDTDCTRFTPYFTTSQTCCLRPR